MNNEQFDMIRGALIAETMRDMHDEDLDYRASIVATMFEEITFENNVVKYANTSATGITCWLAIVEPYLAVASTDGDYHNEGGTVEQVELDHQFDIREIVDFFRKFIATHMC
ncbi:hypothetical protein TIN4_95 [Tsukamurella phage TIN4]|uniref:Uncharacterized protein n=2 Tax=Tinduovirus TIN3 TaxID=1982571 RepID=A0A0K0N5X4_9CAUD|nr:hypothetical protein AVT54_gp030 [Tsukamurella phage TIN3]YP_009604225.1 hypothetical protein FDH87_gp030 [Tsukamurella phage TIN4]AKJ71892.1 hypothetical protein TIN3_95 [Tsukamurella phage TIN3]AKJ72001.1 hypothetical protein TIN4_95 [Tsukamurella phage TIN4]